MSIFTPDARFQPWWWEAAPRAATANPPLPNKIDVAIVGAGYTGLSAALALARAGRSVVVFDAADPGEGASTRNGGMLGSGHRLSFDALCIRYDRPRALAILKEGLASLDFTVDLIARENLQCAFAQTGRFRAAWRSADYDAMGREIDLLRKEIGLEADMVPRSEQHKEVGTDAYHGGCLYHQHGAVQPALFHKGLLERVVAAGANVVGQTPVAGIESENNGFVVLTQHSRVPARDVIVATNGYTGAATPAFRRRLVPVASYIVATEPLAPEVMQRLIPSGRMIVETRLRHCYYRVAPDERRLLFGGRAALRAIDPRKSGMRLHRLLVELFPDLTDARVTHSWAGLLGFSMDGLPHVGIHNGVHFAMGYSGSGVAMAPYLGYKVAHKVLGSKAGTTALDDTRFAPIPLYNGRPWFLPFLDIYYRLADRMERSA